MSFANSGLPYYLGGVTEDRDAHLLQTPESLAASLNLDVRIGHEVTAIDISSHNVKVRILASGDCYELDYDKLVLCPGPSPVGPKLPGVEHPKIFTRRNIENMDEIKSVLD